MQVSLDLGDFWDNLSIAAIAMHNIAHGHEEAGHAMLGALAEHIERTREQQSCIWLQRYLSEARSHRRQMQSERVWIPEEMASLARFVMPQAPQVEEVLDAIRQTTLDGVAPRRVAPLAAAIYRELARRQIIYDHEPLSLGAAQRVRLPQQILRARGPRVATCLESSHVFAACLEAAHKEPLILQFVHRCGAAHAIAGFWLRPPRLREVVYDDPAVFAFKRPATAVVLETTGITVNRNLTYRAARGAARALFTKLDWSLRFAVDIAEARRRGIMPWDYPGDWLL